MKLKHKKIKVSFLLTFTIVFSVIGQENNNFNIFDKYRNYGFSVAPVFFRKASIDRKYGNMILNTNPTFNLTYNIKKYFRKEKEWSYFAGIKLNVISSANNDFILKAYDIPFDEDYYYEDSQIEHHHYLSGLLGVENKMQISNNLFFNANVSVNVSYLQNGGIYSSVTIADEETQIYRENFALRSYTQDNEIQGSATISAGLYFPLKYFLLQTNVVYNKNFQNILEGEYLFGNLFVSESTRGDYKLSGDYLGLSFTVFLKKSKKKLIKRIQ
jgi:hypothetical protein